MTTTTREFFLPGVSVGHAVDPAGPTGCTAILFEAGANAVADFRGGAVASREDRAVSLDDTWGEIDALVFAGGSTWGSNARGSDNAVPCVSVVVHRLPQRLRRQLRLTKNAMCWFSLRIPRIKHNVLLHEVRSVERVVNIEDTF